MRSRTLPLAALAALTGSGACVPDRGNPDDPVNKPVAVLGVAAQPPGTDCDGAATATDGWTPSGIASRGRCLALDARGSRCKHGGSARLTFTADGEELVEAGAGGVGDYVTATAGLAVLTRSRILTLSTGGTPTEFVVEVDCGASHNEADSSLFLLNERPIAVGDAPRSLPIGGQPWAPSSTYSVVLEGAASFDPDGEPLVQYCWELAPDDRRCAADGETSITIDIPAGGPLRKIAYLTVSDGSVLSRRTPVIVDVAGPVIWTRAETTVPYPATVKRVDTEYRGLLPSEPDSTQPVLLTAANGAHRVLVAAFHESSLDATLLSWPELVPIGPPVSLGGDGSGRLCASESGSSLFAAVLLSEDPETWEFGRFDLAADGSSLVLAGDAIPLPVGAGGITADSLDRVWISGTEPGEPPGPFLPADKLVMIQGSGVTTVTSGGELGFVAIAARPGTGEMWSLNAPAQGSAESSLAIWRDASSGPEVHLLPDGTARAMVWASARELWVATSAALLLLDADAFAAADALEPQARLDAATVLELPGFGDIYSLTADRLTDSVWAIDGFGQVHFANMAGVQTILGPGEAPSFVDPLGRVFTSPVASASRASGAAFHSETPSLDGNAAASIAPDGGVWKASVFEHAFVRFRADGQEARRVTLERPIGGGPAVPIRPFNQSSDARVSPDGESAWVFRPPLELRHYDLRGPIAIVQDVPLPGLSYGSTLVAASAPLPGREPFVWMTASDGVGTYVTTVTPSGVVTFRQQLQGTYGAYARSPRTNDLCVAIVDFTNTLTVSLVRAYDPPPAIVPLAAIPLSPPQDYEWTELRGVAWSGVASDTCWVAYTVGPETVCGIPNEFSTVRIDGYSQAAPMKRLDVPYFDAAVGVFFGAGFPIASTGSSDVMALGRIRDTGQPGASCSAPFDALVRHDFNSGVTTVSPASGAVGFAPR